MRRSELECKRALAYPSVVEPNKDPAHAGVVSSGSSFRRPIVKAGHVDGSRSRLGLEQPVAQIVLHEGLPNVARRGCNGSMAEDMASTLAEDTNDQLAGAWHDSLIAVMRDVVVSLPDDACLGDLIEATRKNRHLAPLLGRMTVQELIDMARQRRADGPASDAVDSKVQLDEEGNPLMDLPDAATAIVRRRADVPDGDAVILRCLADDGAQSEATLARLTQVSSEQLRLLIRQLRRKGYLHVEGSGPSRRYRVTRSGNAWLRKQRPTSRSR